MNLSLKSLSFSAKKPRMRLTQFRIQHPERDWLLGLLLAGILLCAGGGYAGWLFFSGVQDLGGELADEATTKKVYNHARVTQLLKDYDARAARFDALRNSGITPQRVTPDAPAAATTTTESVASTPAVAEDATEPVE